MTQKQIVVRLTNFLLLILLAGCYLDSSYNNDDIRYDNLPMGISFNHPSDATITSVSSSNLEITIENLGYIEVLSRDLASLSAFVSTGHFEYPEAAVLVLQVWATIYAPSGATIITEGPTTFKLNNNRYEAAIMEMRSDHDNREAIIATIVPNDGRVIIFIAVPENPQSGKQQLRQILENVILTTTIGESP